MFSLVFCCHVRKLEMKTKDVAIISSLAVVETVPNICRLYRRGDIIDKSTSMKVICKSRKWHL